MILGFKEKSRTGYIALGVLLAFAIIVVRLFFLQIVDGAKYKAMANQEQNKQYEIKAQRGLIYAMDGSDLTKLVLNETVYTLWADPHEIAEDKRSEIIQTIKQVPVSSLFNACSTP